MWRLAEPILALSDTFPVCVAAIDDPEIRSALAKREQQVLDLNVRFVEAMKTSTVHELLKADFKFTEVEDDELVDLYNSHFVAAESVGRPFYDAIRTAAQFCCACQHRQVGTLDHYLPKKQFPALAVAPANLTSMCKDCNQAKSSGVAKSFGASYVHPYFDDFEDSVWLAATVHSDPVPHLKFHAAPGPWHAEIEHRLTNHINKFKLNALYSVEAARLIAEYHGDFESAWQRGKRAEIELMTLEAEQKARAHQLNSWKAATWSARSASHWFCMGGFRDFVD